MASGKVIWLLFCLPGLYCFMKKRADARRERERAEKK